MKNPFLQFCRFFSGKRQTRNHKKNSAIRSSSLNRQRQQGFTVIEMLVAISVSFVFFSGMFLSQGDFDSTVRLSSTARDVALLVRQAQTYGAGGGSDISIGDPHGIYLSEGNPNRIILYADEEDPKSFDENSVDQIVETLNIPSTFEIKEFCLADTDNLSGCGTADTKPSQLSVYFVRPSLEANFFHSGSVDTSAQSVNIVIAHPSSNTTKIIKIGATGYISTP